MPCDDFDTDKIEFSKICNTTVQSCITSYTNGSKSRKPKVLKNNTSICIFCLTVFITECQLSWPTLKAILLDEFVFAEVSLRDCWTRSLETTKCDGVKNVLMLCMCATDFCNCHSSPDLNGDSCPHPPSGATSVNFSGWGFFPLLVLIFQVAM